MKKMFEHCSKKFKHSDILYLFDNKEFFDRRILVFQCPICNKTIAKLIQIRRTDCSQKESNFIGKKADKLIEKIKYEINYTYQEVRLKKIKCKLPLPRGFRYGENIELKNGEVRRYAVALTGNCSKELVE